MIRIIFTVCFLFCFVAHSTGQSKEDSLVIFDYSETRKFNIGGIDVVGAEQRDRNAIKSIAGLREGKQIQIPGDDIPKAIKALWKLKLFEDVQILQKNLEGDLIFLEIFLRERPTLSRYSIRGVKKSRHEEITEIIDRIANKGSIVTDDVKNLCILKIKELFRNKGFLDTEVDIEEILEETENTVRLVFNIEKNEKVKIANIEFTGNSEVRDGKLRKQLKNTKRKKAFFKKSKFLDKDYKEDKKNLITYYNNNGFRDATIVKDSIWRDDNGELNIRINVDEGDRYYFRNITWKGNSKYTDEQLNNVLGIVRGDLYDPDLLEKRLRFSLDGRDISSLYLDDGYLGFTADPVEIAIVNDSVDLEMQIFEGPQFTVDNVLIKGNDRTHEHVIRRELRTTPGKKFSRSDIIRSQREIMNLGYFNPENLDIQTPVNQNNGTVDIEYTVEERPSDQLELSAGYGGQTSGLIGTLGVTFNNFSIRNIRDKSTWSPLPQGDGQKLSLRAQSNSRFFKSFNFSFTEPWLGGKRSNAFTVGAVLSSFNYETLGLGSLTILRGFAGLGTQLQWPDDFFSSSTTLTLESIRLNDYTRGDFFVDQVAIDQGYFKNFSIRQVFSRSSVNEPIFPRRGSRISLSIQLTPPYSLFRSDNYWILSDEEAGIIIDEAQRERGPGNPLTQREIDRLIFVEESARKFEWLEYHKWRFDGEWYFNLVDKFVLTANAKIAYVGAYNNDIGVSPFERFEVGGDGISNQNVGITGRDIIALRGYDVFDLEQNINNNGGATVFNKYTLELRYPLSLNPSSTIYFHTFAQGGNSWGSFRDFNPFDMKRSAGFGMRVFLPMFGLLGFDYGFGFDKATDNYGKFNIIIGFEPD